MEEMIRCRFCQVRRASTDPLSCRVCDRCYQEVQQWIQDRAQIAREVQLTQHAERRAT
jgi:hypothetical protein